jgi:hypothetical protein
MALQFTRNAKIYIELGSDIWQVPVLDGFSFTQAINASEITINEAGETSRRARLLFNDNLAPVDWSFSTYVRPFETAGGGSPGDGTWADTAGNVHAVEEVLWAMLAGADTFTDGTGQWQGNSGTTNVNTHVNGATNTFNFNASNVSKFSDSFNIYFSFEDGSNIQVYKITQAVVNSATIDFDIDGIATIQWSGFGKQVVDEKTTVPTRTIYEALTNTSNFIRNRISTVELIRTDLLLGSPGAGDTSSPIADTYTIILTGGSITIENNLTYLVPEELGLVNVPLANVTGPRSISGNITCYLDNDQANDKSGELFADLVADTSTVRNVFNMAVNVGGTGNPSVAFDLPTAHLEVPVINVEDLLTLDVTFHGQVADGNVDNTDEATIIYRA